jgi:hypothetical protein
MDGKHHKDVQAGVTLDPVREKYYRPCETADLVETTLFYAGVALSISIAALPRSNYEGIERVLVTLFGLVVIGCFVTSQLIRLYLMPRALRGRQSDFCSHAFGTDLASDKTVNYYNNAQTSPAKRIAAQVLESSYFTNALLSKVARRHRWLNGGYLTIWLTLMFYRGFDFGVILAISQALFSEQLVSKWLRVEWLRLRTEAVYRDTYACIQGQRTDMFSPNAVFQFVQYESAKANAATIVHSKDYKELRFKLASEWNEIRNKMSL